VNSTGVVTGVSGGTSTIFYAQTNGCGTIATTLVIFVDPLPVVDTITGITTVCAGSSILLNDLTPWGTWSSSAVSIATVSNTGIVAGLNTGTATISYSVTNGCGTVSALKTITVNTIPVPGAITGADSVCPGHTITLSDALPGGVWGTDFATIAHVTNTGVVTGVATGADTIRYYVTNSCGSASTSIRIEVLSATSTACEAANVSAVTGSASTELKVFPNPNIGTFTVLISAASDEQAAITITNVVGEKVKEFATTTNQNTEVKLNATPGIYFVSAIIGGNRYYAKIVVDRQ
jgi:hypothetical protein